MFTEKASLHKYLCW